jgi:hypothetical protein
MNGARGQKAYTECMNYERAELMRARVQVHPLHLKQTSIVSGGRVVMS